MEFSLVCRIKIAFSEAEQRKIPDTGLVVNKASAILIKVPEIL